MGTAPTKPMVYRQLILLMLRVKKHVFGICEKLKLTPVQGMLLISLEPGQAKTMNELSEMMGCDASNVTGLTDRLLSGGYIERVASESDRRVKEVQLTATGEKCRAELLNGLAAAEAFDMDKLTENECACLCSIPDKLL